MELQFKGGLSGKEIIGIFTTKNEAEKVAKMALLKAGAITKFQISLGLKAPNFKCNYYGKTLKINIYRIFARIFK